jgi:hypothetical protein
MLRRKSSTNEGQTITLCGFAVERGLMFDPRPVQKKRRLWIWYENENIDDSGRALTSAGIELCS